ncbi:MAG: HAD family hydrolase [Lachnospiraceae bacterium]|nr:HAD family hydrolase [Lachnospiraceae bacterium]
MRTLYVTDLDGTLLNTKDRISPYSLEVINGLVEQGMLFTYATARSLVSASVVTEGLSTQIPVIVYNGAFIIKPATGEILATAGFEKTETDWVIKVLQENNISPLVYSYIEGFEKVSLDIRKKNEGIQRYLDLRKGDKRFRLLESERGLYDGEIFYFTCIGEETELRPVYERFAGDNRYTCTLQQELYRPEYWLEIMPKRATKAEAIQTLKKLWNCDRVVSFGDAVNDIPMFQISDECYAVKNAVETLKEHATGIIESNEEDGVAKWICRHVSKESSLKTD